MRVSTRARLMPGTIFSPSSSMSCTSHGSMRWNSGSRTFSSVVPMTATVWMGTMMSPSAGILQRLSTVLIMRWFIATIVPLPGMMFTRIPALAATWPAQAPVALMVMAARTVISSPLTTSRSRAPATRRSPSPPSTSRSTIS